MRVWEEPDAQQAGESARPAAERNTRVATVPEGDGTVKRRYVGDEVFTPTGPAPDLLAEAQSMEQQRRQIAEREGRPARSVGGYGFARLAEQRRRAANTPMFRDGDPEEIEQAASNRRRRGY